MNAFSITDSVLDRLVDGELAGDEYREALARLDLEPDGWRRCAMAFLEAQAWQRDFAAARLEPRVARGAADELAAKPVAADTNWTGLFLAMAASFLLAFALGWGFGGRGNETSSSKPTLPTMANVAAPPVKPAPPETKPSEVPVTPAAHRDTANQGEITLLMEDPRGEQKKVNLPVVEVNSAEEIARSLTSSALPAKIQEALERSGHRVVRQRQIIPVELQDGRQLVMPVEDVRVVPIASYQ